MTHVLTLLACFEPGERDFNPELVSVTVSPATAKVGESFTCEVEATDADGDEPVVTRTWTNASTGATLGTNQTYTLDAGYAAPGDVINCAVSVSDADRGLAVTGLASGTVANSEPSFSAVAVSPTEGPVGTPFRCEASALDPDGGSVELAYAWSVNDTELGTGQDYTLSPGDGPVGGELLCTVSATDATGAIRTTEDSATITNSAPGAPSLSIVPERPIEQVDDVVCVVSTEAPDVDGDAVGYTFAWTVDGVDFADATTTTHPGDTVPAVNTVYGQSWTCVAVPSDGTDEGPAGEVEVPIYRYNRAPTIDTLSLSASTARVGDTLSCSGTASDADGHSFTLAYQWTNDTDGTVLASSASYTLTAAGTNPGDTLSCTLTATDSEGWDGSDSRSATVLNTVPTAPGVAVSPAAPVEGLDDLVCEVTTASSDADGQSVDYDVAWEVDGVAFTATSTTTLSGDTVSYADTAAGELWTCTVTPTDGSDDGPAGSDSVTIVAEGVVAVAGGSDHSVALLADGTVWAWGWNGYGQLGDGTTTNSSTPVQVSGLTDIVAIAVGGSHALAIRDDGSLWAWGHNGYGQLGDGTKTNRSTPVEITSLADVVAIDGSNGHSLAVLGDGSVWAWGDNSYGQLGDGTYTTRTSPTEVSGLGAAVSVSAGYYHSHAVLADGTAWGWGWNAYGQLGDGTTDIRTAPVAVSTLSGVAGVSAYRHTTVAFLDDGSLWTWGDNDYGQIGDGTNSDRVSPTEITALVDVVSIATGSLHVAAALADGSVYAWGYNSSGQVGDGSTSNRSTPAEATGVTGATAVGAGHHHTLALLDDGTLVAWGYNGTGQLGDGTTTNRSTYVAVTGVP